ncbi:PUA-like domain-containing protein [Massariosphaeria phaeospora]|uniref:Thymocyte nuclear protein 1 n=1 Tax=Massariosphaeria phaeospora TaxID=100035 RepID=A0A7C8HYD5_9PLEO|nr:PUA-like domain-containing protein [Massariosphaeria phaeospora]
MAGTRSSARQAASKAPQYADDSSSHSGTEAPKRKARKTTRRKRARDEDENEDIDDGEDVDEAEQASPPPKKAKIAKPAKTKKAPKVTAKPKANPKANPTKPAATSKPDAPAPPADTNRDAAGAQQTYWLLKAEPLPRYENGTNVSFSIDDLAACTVPEPWSGVRNPQARNNMRAMRAGDLGFFYHSNAKPPGVAGILRVAEEAKVDETAFEPADPYYDAKSEREAPKWWCVGVEFVRKFGAVVGLKRIKGEAGKGGALEGMQLVTNSRLSVSRVSRDEWEYILGMVEEDDDEDGEKVTEQDDASVEDKGSAADDGDK